MLKKIIFRGIALPFFMVFLFSCSPYFHQPLGIREAELGAETPLKRELLNLPEPKEQIVVAVYKFRDQTGQYKASETGANWSTAITQGATNILIRALEESGWFVPIERENIGNLLNERKIIRSSREQYEGSSNILLPPLLFAGVLIEGGIVSYETNVFTGGAGVRYFGTDASAQYREDRVSIYLRAVSTSNGKILKTVYTTKSVLSQEVSMGLFRYVKFKRLLEAETGYTYNEPTEMAVTEAIEKAIHSLVIEGILDNLWTIKNPEDNNLPVFKNYISEKQDNLEEDLMGRKYDLQYRSKGFVSLNGSGQWYNGDYSRSVLRPGGSLNFGLGLNRSFFLETSFGPKVLHIENVYGSTEYDASLNLMFLANTRDRYSPYLKAGVGTLHGFGETVGLSDKKWMPYLAFGGGMEYLFTRSFGITGGTFFNQFLSDSFDGSPVGQFNDSLWGFELGLKIYF
ncbi:MAG TPA: curli production assembly/transport component CsgG [Mariniphaga anaerophila]|uniref:Curli production assembly/transport component CsgG n=1 Tax=Mariniphaga anaerophila TaxID=1484053 RepID=A0A831L969_9BACT|nr:curli production assembly/transport component CsgG [Mariniphaga anaerophila]